MKQPLPEKAICREGRLFLLFVLPQKGSYEIEATRTTEKRKHQQTTPGRNLRPFSYKKAPKDIMNPTGLAPKVRYPCILRASIKLRGEAQLARF